MASLASWAMVAGVNRPAIIARFFDRDELANSANPGFISERMKLKFDPEFVAW